MSEKFTIEITRRTTEGVDEVLRSHSADSVDDAEAFVDSLRESYFQRESVVWDGEEVDTRGHLHGMSHGQVYTISVVPPTKDWRK
jgi:hypothetical protein